MFDDNKFIEDEINRLLEIYTLEEVLELCDLTPFEAIKLLIENGNMDIRELVKPV